MNAKEDLVEELRAENQLKRERTKLDKLLERVADQEALVTALEAQQTKKGRRA